MTLPTEVVELVSAFDAQISSRGRANPPAPTLSRLETIAVAVVLGDHPAPPTNDRPVLDTHGPTAQCLLAADLRTRAETCVSLWRPYGATVLLVDANAAPALQGPEVIALRAPAGSPCAPNGAHQPLHHGLALGAAFATALLETHPDLLVFAGGGVGYHSVALVLADWLHTQPPRHHTAGAFPFAQLADHCLLVLTGAILAAASAGTPLLVDGVAATIAATLACLLVPAVREAIWVAANDSTTHALVAWAQWQPILQQQLGIGESASAAIACATLRRQLAGRESPG